MIYLIYGDDIAKSLEKLDDLLKDAKNVTRFSLPKTHLSEILMSFESQELFIQEKTIILENTSKYGKENLDILVPKIRENQKSKDITIILWEASSVFPTFLKKFPGIASFDFFLPKYFFNFLDSLHPKNGKDLHSIMYKMSPLVVDEQIFYAMVKRVRLLMMIKTGKESEFQDFKKMSPWQISKLQKQANLWTEEKLISFYKNLLELEINLKTSNLSTKLINHLDILLLTEL